MPLAEGLVSLSITPREFQLFKHLRDTHSTVILLLSDPYGFIGAGTLLSIHPIVAIRLTLLKKSLNVENHERFFQLPPDIPLSNDLVLSILGRDFVNN